MPGCKLFWWNIDFSFPPCYNDSIQLQTDKGGERKEYDAACTAERMRLVEASVQCMGSRPGAGGVESPARVRHVTSLKVLKRLRM